MWWRLHYLDAWVFSQWVWECACIYECPKDQSQETPSCDDFMFNIMQNNLNNNHLSYTPWFIDDDGVCTELCCEECYLSE